MDIIDWSDCSDDSLFDGLLVWDFVGNLYEMGEIKIVL